MLGEAVAAIRGDMSQVGASQRWKISRGTLQNKLKGRINRPPGHPTVFQPEEEQLLTKTLRQFYITILRKKGRVMRQFKDNTPEHDFMEHFTTRNNLSFRLASNIKRARAAVGPNDIRKFFNNIEGVLRHTDPQLVFNYDENNVQDDPGAKKDHCSKRNQTSGKGSATF
ncbi:hypothetical protein NQ314_009496 [Rhamnusium bicolor]|uniref:HTH psq-type domain-containing protein n=1 Tax=Rhamnusium bicolor TaxID=1586634 RepID=A0AAV8Y0B9_9CUCU|nr:hypothetical protein NQ314_009496 [Rhamnusium bicolor]